MASTTGVTRRTVIVGFIIGLHVMFFIGLSAGLDADSLLKGIKSIAVDMEDIKDDTPPPPPPPPPADFVPPPIELPPAVDLPQLAEAPTNNNAIDIPSQPVQPKAEPVVQQAPLVASSKFVNYFKKNKPPFPSASRRLQEEGSAVVQLNLSAAGETSCSIVTGTGFARLDEAALRWCTGKTFPPATQGGVPVASSFKLKYTFKLEDE